MKITIVMNNNDEISFISTATDKDEKLQEILEKPYYCLNDELFTTINTRLISRIQIED